MKKKLTIEIDIDTDTNGISAAYLGNIDASKCRIEIRKDLERIGLPVDHLLIAVMTAHELGHVLGALCELPCNLADPRMKDVTCAPPWEKSVIDSEKEAWDIAEEMFKIKRVRQISLRTYGESYENTYYRFIEPKSSSDVPR